MFAYLIKNGRVIDGTGRAAYSADIGIADGKIVQIGAPAGASAAVTIDAAGKYVTPGFIDIHRHADAAAFRPGFGELELAQGLTTIVNGNCGLSIAPSSAQYRAPLADYLSPVLGAMPPAVDVSSMQAYLAALKQRLLPLNVAMLAGSGTLRACVAGFDTVELSREQLRQIQDELTRTLSSGVLGVSLGLGYAPDCFYDTDTLIEALAPLRDSGLPITVHMRQEGSGVVDALREMIAVARALRTPVQISHLKSIGKANWRKTTPQMLQLMQRARQEGIDIGCDVYPYTAGSTQLVHVLPPECQQGGMEALTQNLSDGSFREQLKERMLHDTDFENISLLAGFENILVSSICVDALRQYEGKSIAQIAHAQGKDAFTCLFDLLEQAHCDVTMIDFIADEEDICDILRDTHSCVISDSTYPTTGLLHPRVYGTYSTLLEHFVRERGVLSIEQAVHKCTQRPAQVMHLQTKGVLAEGMDADVNIFDLNRIHTCASYADSAHCSEGMDTVFVAGEPVILNGRFTHKTPGQVLTR